jgi:hypothetical protein
LGASENFAFASVDSQGEVTPMTQVPSVIANGYSEPNELTSTSSSNENSNTNNESTNTNDTANVASTNIDASTQGREISEQSPTSDTPSVEVDTAVYNESEWQGVSSTPIAELIAERTGTLNYNNVTQSSIEASAGAISNFNMDMTIDFDNASVPGGSLSFTDAQGAWFATYSGLINVDEINLGINFASHGDNHATGSIFAAFSNGLDEITGGFNLHEINNTTVTAAGSFKVQP